MSSVSIRAGEADDAESLTELHLDCWDDAYTGLIGQDILDARRDPDHVQERVEGWRGLLGRGNILIAELADGGGMIGFACTGPGRDDGADADPDLELEALYVRRAHWDTGLGHALLERAIGARACYLWVLDGNARSIRFYERHGFRRDGVTLEATEGLHVRMVRN